MGGEMPALAVVADNEITPSVTLTALAGSSRRLAKPATERGQHSLSYPTSKRRQATELSFSH